MKIENKNINTETDIEEKLINSVAVNSLIQETKIYKLFKELGWRVEHSPYYIDNETGKLREVDISARKFWSKGKRDTYSFGVNFVVECKSINNYHIIASNELDYKCGETLEDTWIGDDGLNNYVKTIELLKKHNIKDRDIQDTLKKLHKFLFPKGLVRYYDYRLDTFDIPIFNSFRETNIGSTKDLDNSVVWKAFQSLNSCILAHQALTWNGIDYEIYNVENEGYISTYKAKLDELFNTIKDSAKHLEYIHPVLAIEANLWELKNKKLKELKYFRLIFQKMFENEMWVDIVSINHLDE